MPQGPPEHHSTDRRDTRFLGNSSLPSSASTADTAVATSTVSTATLRLSSNLSATSARPSFRSLLIHGFGIRTCRANPDDHCHRFATDRFAIPFDLSL